MKKRLTVSRDLVSLLVLIVLIGAATAFVAFRSMQAEQALLPGMVPSSSYSASDTGTLALHDWYSAIGYASQRIENQAFRVPDNVHLLFVIGPTSAISRDEALYLLNWVERGNTLYVADNGIFTSNGILDQLGVTVDDERVRSSTISLVQPLVAAELGVLEGTSFAQLKSDRNDNVPYANSQNTILMRIPRGNGTIWLTSAPNLLSNRSLRSDENAKFALALAAGVPRGGGIAFDEYHHGLNNGANDFMGAVYSTPWGWGILTTLALAFGYLVWNGRRFGRTIPVRRTLARRMPSEYVVSMANLFRRANKRGMVLQHYRHALKRRLGRAFHLNPELADEKYIEMLTRMRPDIDRAELTRILNGLRRAETSELDLVKSVEQSVTFATRGAKK